LRCYWEHIGNLWNLLGTWWGRITRLQLTYRIHNPYERPSFTLHLTRLSARGHTIVFSPSLLVVSSVGLSLRRLREEEGYSALAPPHVGHKDFTEFEAQCRIIFSLWYLTGMMAPKNCQNKFSCHPSGTN
jgi:hypothetical protein